LTRIEVNLKFNPVSTQRGYHCLAVGLAISLCLPVNAAAGAAEASSVAFRERIWNSAGPDDGSVHCLGNGELMAYEQGPNIIQIFGPPYAAPQHSKSCWKL
jgi:hypothetical protein